MYREVARPEKQIPTRKFVKKSYSTGQLVVKPVSDATAVELSFSPKDSGNVFEAHVDSNGTMTVDKGTLEDDFTLRAPLGTIIIPANKLLKGKKLTIDTSMLLNDGVIHCNRGDFKADYLFENKGRLVTAGDCTLCMPESYFRNSGYGQLGVLNIKGNLTYEGLGSVFENKAGTISVDKHIVIEASEVRNRPQPTRKDHDKPLFKYKRCVKDAEGNTGCYARECENSHEVATSGPGTITCAGSCQITAHTVANSASTVHAEGPLTITATRVYNSRHLLKQLTCTATDAKTSGKVTRGEYHDLLPACLSSGDSVTFILNGISYKHTTGELSNTIQLAGLENTGHIIAKQNIGALKNPQTSGQLATSVFNGLQKASEHKPHFAYKAEMLSLVPQEPLVKALPQARLAPESPYYKHVSTVNETTEPLGIDEIVCTVGAPRRFTPETKFLYSPQLQAQLVSQVIFKHTTGSFLYGLGDLMSQFTELKERGFLYGLVYGALHKLPDTQEEPLPVFINDQDRAQLREALTLFDTTRYTTIEALETRLRLLRSGNYLLTLDKQQIANAPCSFLYYDCFKNELVPYVHISKKDFDKNLNLTGSLRAKNISLNVSKVVNTGSIIAFDKVEIKAQSVKNTRLVHKRIDKHTTQDVWGTYHKHQYTIYTPQPGGQIVGFVVEVEVPEAGTIPDVGGHKGILNKGGTIEGTCKVSLIAKQGDVDNRHVLSSTVILLERGFFAELSGKPERSVAHDFKAGQIKSQGDIELLADAGKVLNIASSIIADKNVKLKGYGGVLLKTMANKHTALSGSKLNGLTYQELEAEALTMGKAQVLAKKGDITLESENIVHNQGAYTKSGGNTYYNGKKGNKIESVVITTDTIAHDVNFLLPFMKADKIKVDRVIMPESVAGGGVHLETELDNVLEAAIMTDVGAIYLTAGRDNSIKGATAKTTYETDTWSLGIKFFGSDALASLSGLDTQGALWSLANEDPLLRSLVGLYNEAHADGHYGVAGAKSTLEIVRLLAQYKNNAQSVEPSVLRALGQRLGLANQEGGFSLGFTIQAEHSTTHATQTQTHKTAIDAKKVVINSERDTILQDGAQIIAEEATVNTGRDFTATGATDTATMDRTTVQGTVGVGPQGINSVGGGITQENREQTKHTQGGLHAKRLDMKVGGDLKTDNFDLNGDDAKFDVKGNIDATSTPDTDRYTKSSFSATAGTQGSFNAGGERINQQSKTITTPTGIHFKHLDITADKLLLRGAYVLSGDLSSYIKARLIEYANVDEEIRSEGWRAYVSHTPVEQTTDGIHTTFESTYDARKQRGITRATVDKNIHLETESDTSTLNRDAQKMQERFEQETSSFGVFVPLIDGRRFSEHMDQLREFFSERMNKPCPEHLNDVTQEMLFSNPAEQENELRERLKAQAEEAEIKKLEEQKANQDISQQEQEKLEELKESRQERQEAQEAYQEELKQEILQEAAQKDPDPAPPAEPQQAPEPTSQEEPADINPQVDYTASWAKTADGGTVEIETTSVKIEQDAQQPPLQPQIPYIVDITNDQGVIVVTLRDDYGNAYKVRSTHATLDGLMRNYAEQLFRNGGVPKSLLDQMAGYTPLYSHQVHIEDLASGKVQETSRWKTYGLMLFSLVLDCTPYVGSAKSVYEAWTGIELLSREKMGVVARGITVAGIAFPVLNKLRKIKLSKAVKAFKEFVEEGFKDSSKIRKILRTSRPGFIRLSAGSSSKLANSITRMKNQSQKCFSNPVLKEELELLVSKSKGAIKDINILELFNDRKIDHIFDASRHHLEVLMLDIEEISYKVGKELISLDQLKDITGLLKEGVEIVVDGYKIVVRGTILDGKMKWGTFFVKHARGVCPTNPCPFI